MAQDYNFSLPIQAKEFMLRLRNEQEPGFKVRKPRPLVYNSSEVTITKDKALLTSNTKTPNLARPH